MASDGGVGSQAWAHVERALEHYGDGLVEAATAELEQAVRLRPADRRLGRMLDWLRRPLEETAEIVVEPLHTGDTLDDAALLAVQSALGGKPREPTKDELELEMRREATKLGGARQMAALADAFDEHARPQVTPAPPLAPMQPIASEPSVPPEAEIAAPPEVEIFAEPTRHPISLDALKARAPRRTSDRMAPHDEFRATPSKVTRPPGTLLGLPGASMLQALIDDPQPTTPLRRGTGQAETSPSQPAAAPPTPPPPVEREAPEREFEAQRSPPRGTQMLYKITPEDITTTRARPDLTAAVAESPRRTPSDKRTNPYLRTSAGEVDQAFVDLQMAVEANAALEGFELAERAIEMAGSGGVTETQRQLLIAAYELALGPLEQVVHHGQTPAALDPRTAFLLSRIDGTMSVDELLEISGMPRLEALRLLAQLLRQGVVEF